MLSVKAWRVQAEAGKLRWQKVTLRLQRPKTVEVVRVRGRETTTQAWLRPGPERWLLIKCQMRRRQGQGVLRKICLALKESSSTVMLLLDYPLLSDAEAVSSS
jgi:hypothetical protein